MDKKQAGKLGFLKSQQTQQLQKQQRIDKYNENPVICKHCGKSLPYEDRHKKFCNSSCAATYSNLRRTRKYPVKEIIDENNNITFIRDRGNCLNCGKPLQNNQKKFCNAQCQGQYKNKQLIEQWQQGKHPGVMPNGQVSPFIKSYLLQKHNYKCELCGWDKVNPHTGKIPLEIHHKDGNWQNNKEDNLQVLCPNCHSLTANYKASNKGNGRKR